jgi:hypothetical protein
MAMNKKNIMTSFYLELIRHLYALHGYCYLADLYSPAAPATGTKCL